MLASFRRHFGLLSQVSTVPLRELQLYQKWPDTDGQSVLLLHIWIWGYSKEYYVIALYLI